MSFKLVVFAAAVLTCQVNAQVGSIVRPFISGYVNGLTEFTKPFAQLSQALISPAGEYIPTTRPQMGQWVVYPNRGRPRPPVQAQSISLEGFESLPSAMPSRPSILQFLRPRPFRPQFFPIHNGVRPYPFFPYPAPVPSFSEEKPKENNIPSSLFIKPDQDESVIKPLTEKLPSSVEDNVHATAETNVPSDLESEKPETLEANVQTSDETNVIPDNLEEKTSAGVEAKVPTTLEDQVPATPEADLPRPLPSVEDEE